MRRPVALAAVVFLLPLVGLLTACGPAGDTADLVLVNGTVYTLDDSQPWAEAIAVRGDRLMAVGELSLDGSVHPISGVLPIALAARQARYAGLIVPADNIAEATVLEGLDVYPVRTLWEAAEVVARPEQRAPAPTTAGEWRLSDPEYAIDFSEGEPLAVAGRRF